MDDMLDRLATSVTGAKSLEELTRPLLLMLQGISGLDSTYLTVIDLPRDEQRIVYSHNAHTMQIPEGLAVPWGDTLCKRALDQNQPFTDNVSACWGDSEAAKALGIETYLSTPVRLGDDTLYGTLCAASTTRQTPSEQVRHVLGLFAALIGQHIEREQLLHKLVQSNELLARQARTDPLTGLPNRRGMLTDLGRMLAHGERTGGHVLVAFIDLDGFKAINDSLGHEAGDEFLVAMAAKLSATLRKEDLAARIGGDEFVVIGPGPTESEQLSHARAAFGDRLAAATEGHFTIDGQPLHYPGASVGLVIVAPGALDAAQALDAADEAMYDVKRQRRAARPTARD